MFERRERFVTATERRRMRELREQRMSIAEIARLVKRPRTTVWDHVHTVCLRGHVPPPEQPR